MLLDVKSPLHHLDTIQRIQLNSGGLVKLMIGLKSIKNQGISAETLCTKPNSVQENYIKKFLNIH